MIVVYSCCCLTIKNVCVMVIRNPLLQCMQSHQTRPCSSLLHLWQVGYYILLYTSVFALMLVCMTGVFAAIPSLADRREQLSRKFLKSIRQPSSCLFTLLPNPRDPSVTTRLRSANKLPRLPSRTRKYQTFISYALSQYQSA